MAEIANIAIYDGAATPLLHTFYPIKSGELAEWRENISGLSLIGQGLTSVLTKLDQKTGLNRVRVTVALPALETVTAQNSGGYTAAPKVGYQNKGSIELILPSRGTAQQRKDLRILLSNALLNAVVSDTIDNLNIPY